MEKFTKKEKVALLVLALLTTAIIVRIAWFREERSPLPEKGILIEESALDLSGNLLTSETTELSASSHNEKHQTVDKLTDNKRLTYWHVDLDKIGEPAWVTIDFGEGNTRTVRKIMALPRVDTPAQFIRRAELRGSSDGESWNLIGEIIEEQPPTAATWRKWELDNEQPYRYYRLVITRGHEDGDRYNFYSMAELAFSE